MNSNYSFLKDLRALAEIRKYKWIESQKQGREIGIATAAFDWIKNYGQDWLKIHGEEMPSPNLFVEKRKYRRFKLKATAKLIKDGCAFLGELLDLIFFGFLCRTKKFWLPGNKVFIDLALPRNQESRISCSAIIERLVPIGNDE
ncbi:MAG: hypothetical protein PHV17_08755, partial [Candidatus Omnitrophica bacterium]|nr:hypothetical protein [Candidatus Omnitrophota bacterium]